MLSRLAGPSAACPASACRTPLPCGPTTLRAAWVSPTATCSTFAKPSGPVNRLQDARMSVVNIPAAAAPRRPARLAPLRAAAVTTDGPATTASPDDDTATTASPATAEPASSSSAFAALGLIPELQSALAKLNIGEPTEIQVGLALLPPTMLPAGVLTSTATGTQRAAQLETLAAIDILLVRRVREAQAAGALC